MHIKRIKTNLLSFLLLAQFIIDTQVSILGWLSNMLAKRLAQRNTCTPQHEGMHLHQRDITIYPQLGTLEIKCLQCQVINKVEWHKVEDLLNPLDIPNNKWDQGNYVYDFYCQLGLNKRCQNSIWFVSIIKQNYLDLYQRKQQ